MIRMFIFLALVTSLMTIYMAATAHGQIISTQVGGKTMDEHIAIINGQDPPWKNDHGVRITNGQTGKTRKDNPSFDRNTRDLCASAYPGDNFGQMMCRDNERELRSLQFDRYFGIGRFRDRSVDEK